MHLFIKAFQKIIYKKKNLGVGRLSQEPTDSSVFNLLDLFWAKVQGTIEYGDLEMTYFSSQLFVVVFSSFCLLLCCGLR